MLSPHASSCMYVLGHPAHTGPNPKPPAVLFSRASPGHAVQVLCFKCLQVKRRKSNLFHYHRAGPVGGSGPQSRAGEWGVGRTTEQGPWGGWAEPQSRAGIGRVRTTEQDQCGEGRATKQGAWGGWAGPQRPQSRAVVEGSGPQSRTNGGRAGPQSRAYVGAWAGSQTRACGGGQGRKAGPMGVGRTGLLWLENRGAGHIRSCQEPSESRFWKNVPQGPVHPEREAQAPSSLHPPPTWEF